MTTLVPLDVVARSAPARAPLRRPRASLVTGVSAGLAAHLDRRPFGVRALFVALAPLGGAGALLYLWFWALVPLTDPDQSLAGSDTVTHRAPVAWILTTVAVFGTALTAIIVAPARGQGMEFVPAAVVLATSAVAVTAGLWATVVDRRDPARGPRHEAGVRLVLTILLGYLFVATVMTLQQGGILAFSLALVPLVGIGAIYASTLIEKWRELSRERVRRIREEQRSEMAAHLHDSVLQTLALIQNRAGASSEVARIARAQERELRGWLYDGDEPADSDLPTDLRDYAAALELDYPVHFDVVAAGASAERASGELAAAAREAMLNAARHAGGEVAVYIEGSAARVDVFVRDRGPGFSLDEVAQDRLGVRESIVARMRRAGGSATVRPGAGGVGTEVHLAFERMPEAGRA